MKNIFQKISWKKESRGETLLEVIIAILIVTMGAATATTLIILAIDANIFNRDSLIAINLSQEGIEYMRNLRDTNWITFSADKKNCWEMAPGTTSCSTPYGSALAEKNSGTTNSGYPLGLVLGNAVTGKLDLTDGISATEGSYLINNYDLNTSVDSDGDGNVATDKDIMGSGISGAGTALTGTTKFYRSIEVTYDVITPGTWALVAAASPQAANLMIVTSRVQWMDGPIPHEVTLSSALSNYKQ